MTSLVTSVEDREEFEKITENVVNHENTSFHGLAIIAGEYSDARRVKLSDEVLVWQIGGNFYYSPVQPSTALPDKVAPSFDGVYALAGKDVALQTDADSRRFPDLASLQTQLDAHVTKYINTAHPTISVTEIDTFNEIGTRVGRYRVSIPYAGSVATIYADNLKTGPPKIPQITLQPKNAQSKAGEGDSQPNITLVVHAVGDFPFTVTWQVYTAAQWVPVVRLEVVESGPASVTVLNNLYIYSFRTSNWQIRYLISSGASLSSTEMTCQASFGFQSHGEDTQSDAFRVRAVVANPYGSVDSNYSSIKCVDKTGCWICTEVDRVHLLGMPNEDLLEFKKWCVASHPKATLFYLKACAELVDRMREKKYDWNLLVDFDCEIIRLAKLKEFHQAYQIYGAKIVQLCQEYWPECTNLGLSKLRESLTLPVPEVHRQDFVQT